MSVGENQLFIEDTWILVHFRICFFFFYFVALVDV